MDNGTCITPGCERPVWVKRTGECSTCQSRRYRRENPGKGRTTYALTCQACDIEYRAEDRRSRFCSLQCKGDAYRRLCRLPADHPVRSEIARQRKDARRAREQERKRKHKPSDFAWRVARECPGCACLFTPLYTPSAITCSKRCSRRVHRWRRKAREVSATGAFTWSEFMRIAARFDYCCAYCGERVGQLQPDHVVPLSRGGSNSTTNLLPSCARCNGDKAALFLDEWATSRAARGLPPRRTNWGAEDRRYWHLTSAAAVAAA